MPQHDDHDDLSAMDFSGGDEHGSAESNALDLYNTGDDGHEEAAANVLDSYGVTESDTSADSETNLDVISAPTGDEGSQTPDDGLEGAQQYTVANPAATVSVSTFIGGTINRVELSPKVASMTESALADEIVVLAKLARQKGQAGQHSYMVEVMHSLGIDDDKAVSDLLEDDLALPTPDKAEAAQAEVFATRYN